MIFEGRNLPDRIDWPSFLPKLLTPTYDIGYGDARPLDWVVRFAKEHTDAAKAVGDAFIAVLERGDAEQKGQVLEQIPYLAVNLAAPLSQVIERQQAALAVQRDPYRDGQSLLGSAVRALAQQVDPTAGTIPPSVATLLEAISDPAHGFPDALLAALRIDFRTALPHLVPAVEKMSPEQLEEFCGRLLNDPSPLCDETFDEIGKNAPGFVRKRVGAAIRDQLGPPSAEALSDYQQLAARNPNLPPPSTEDRWPEYARRLGLSK